MRSVCLMSFFVFITLNISFADTTEDNDIINCDKQALSDTVRKTGLQIQSMKQVYRIALQKQLKALKRHKGWSDKQFLREASTLMKSDQVKAYNVRNRHILASISALNKNRNQTPDCAMLQSLNSHLGEVVMNTQKKWDHMFREIKSAYSPAR